MPCTGSTRSIGRVTPSGPREPAMRQRAARAAAGILVTALVVAGCGADVRTEAPVPVASSDPGVKSGAKPGPIAITIADSQPPGKPSNTPLVAFAQDVTTRSGGTMNVNVLT